jgi:hypothetical protein
VEHRGPGDQQERSVVYARVSTGDMQKQFVCMCVCVCVCVCARAVLGLDLRAYTLNHSTSPFLDGFFQDRISQTICLGWLRMVSLLISS